MSTPTGGTESQASEQHGVATPRWIPILFVVLFVLFGILFYSGHSSRKALETQLAQANQNVSQLTTQLEKANSRLADLKGEVDLTTHKLGLTASQLQQARNAAQAARKAQEAASQQLQAKLGQMQQENTAKMGQISTELGGAKTDIDTTKKDLEATKARLDRTMGDMGVMSGLIAHNRDELEALRQLGERNIYEFNLHKSKKPQRVGPIEVALRKVDTKHFRYSLDVIADDRRIEKKDKTAGEPVQFYTREARMPYEIVVFDLKKNEAVGYLSTPKQPATAQSTPQSAPTKP